MKTYIEIIDSLPEDHYIRYMENTYRTVGKLICDAQIDAWNAALEWAAENARTELVKSKFIFGLPSHYEFKTVISKESILKGKL